jgi:hypothetical protein
MTRRQMRWKNLSSKQRAGVGVLGVIQFVLLAIALIDLARRPSEQVRGRKLAWLPVLFVNIIGPSTYLALGRRRSIEVGE